MRPSPTVTDSFVRLIKKSPQKRMYTFRILDPNRKSSSLERRVNSEHKSHRIARFASKRKGTTTFWDLRKKKTTTTNTDRQPRSLLIESQHTVAPIHFRPHKSSRASRSFESKSVSEPFDPCVCLVRPRVYLVRCQTMSKPIVRILDHGSSGGSRVIFFFIIIVHLG